MTTHYSKRERFGAGFFGVGFAQAVLLPLIRSEPVEGFIPVGIGFMVAGAALWAIGRRARLASQAVDDAS